MDSAAFAQVVSATERMLWWRRVQWNPADACYYDEPVLQPLLPGHSPCLYVAGGAFVFHASPLWVPEEAMLVLVTGRLCVSRSGRNMQPQGPSHASAYPNSSPSSNSLSVMDSNACWWFLDRSPFCNEDRFQHSLCAQNQNVALFGDRLHILPWHLVVTFPLDHQLVPPQRRATATDLVRWCARSHNTDGEALPPGCLKQRSILPAVRQDDPVVQYLREFDRYAQPSSEGGVSCGLHRPAGE